MRDPGIIEQCFDIDIQLGLIGCGTMLNNHVRWMIKRSAAVSFAHLCDIDPAQIARTLKTIGGYQSTMPGQTARYEDVLADENVDAVLITTLHHWHVPVGLAALKAGKDIYIEKPISHVFDEGKLIVAAARKYNRVVQHGVQMRSCPVTAEAGKLLKQGIIGEIKVARAWTAELREPVAPLPDSATPAGVDYDRWLGPAPRRPFNPHRFHSTWWKFRDYGNGEIGDDGAHDLDMARWGLGDPGYPARVTSRGGRMLQGPTVSEYPDNMNVTYEYPDGRRLVYENYPFTEYGMHGFDNGNVFYGTEGYMVFSRRGAFSTFLGRKGKKGPTESREIRGQRGYEEHMDNFLDSVRSRVQTVSPAEIGHMSSTLIHLGEIAYRTQDQLDFDPGAEKFVACDEANSMLTKEYRDGYELPKV